MAALDFYPSPAAKLLLVLEEIANAGHHMEDPFGHQHLRMAEDVLREAMEQLGFYAHPRRSSEA
jgi:hypothetical protein